MKKVMIETRCPMCGMIHVVNVFEEDYEKWQNGTLCQIAFPYLDADERKTLISGICPECWEEMFAEEEDEATDWEEYDYDFDFGFDPYMGCYTGDC